MKFFAMFVVMIALLTALCSAQPVDSLTPGQPDSSFNVRVTRASFPGDRCPPGSIRVGSNCLRYDREYDVDNDFYPEENDHDRRE